MTMNMEHYKQKDCDDWATMDVSFVDACLTELGTLDKLTTPNRNVFFEVGNVRKRLRTQGTHGVTPFEKLALQTTLNNVGASAGPCGSGALFQRLPICEKVETPLLKMLPFESIAKYIVLKHLVTNTDRSFSVEDWQAFCKAFCKRGPVTPRRGVLEEDVGIKDEQVKWYRFNNGTMSLKAPKTLADAFHTSATEWGCVQVGDPRSTDGLERYSFPGERCVSTARRKIFFLLRSDADRVAFCKQQMYGRRDVDLADALHVLRSKSPDNVHIPVDLVNTLARELEDIVGSREGSPEPTLKNERPLKRQCQTTSPDDAHIYIGIGSRKKPRLQEKDQEERRFEHASKSRAGTVESEESAREHAENLLIALGEPVPPIETMNENLRKRYSNAFSVLRGKDAKEPIVFNLNQWLICLAMYLYMTLVEYGLSVTKRENVLQVISIVLAFLFFVVLTTNSGHKKLDFFLYVVGYPICIYAIGIPWHTGIISAVMTIQMIALEFNRSLHHLLGLIVLAFIVSIIFTGNRGIWFVDSWWLLLLRAAPTYCVLYTQRVNNADAAGTIAVSLWRDLPLMLLQICMIFGGVVK